MKKTGIFFQGLQIQNASILAAQEEVCKKADSQNLIREVSSYGKTSNQEVLLCREYIRCNPDLEEFEPVIKDLLLADGECICFDITRFLVFAMAQNPLCRLELQKLTPKERFQYQSLCPLPMEGELYFWSCFGNEESCDAQILYGMAMLAQKEKTSSASRAGRKFHALLQKCWRKARQTLFLEKEIEFSGLQEWAEPYSTQPSLGMGQICVLLVLAELYQIEIKKDMNFYLLLLCMKERLKLWESETAVCVGEESVLIEERKENIFLTICKTYAKNPGMSAPDFYREEWEGFDYYLQNLFHLGGIDRNVLAGEELEEKIQRILVELGSFSGEGDLEDFFYSVQIVLLCKYIKKCREKIQEINPLRIEAMLEEYKKEAMHWKRKMKEALEGEQMLKKKAEELERKLEDAERSIRRKDNQFLKEQKKREEEREELLELREWFHEFV